MRPPSTAVCPLISWSTDSISRTVTCGTRFWIGFGSGAPLDVVVNAGFGSGTNFSTREIVGRTVIVITPLSFTCGVMLMMNPTATVCGVVVTDCRLLEVVVP